MKFIILPLMLLANLASANVVISPGQTITVEGQTTVSCSRTGSDRPVLRRSFCQCDTTYFETSVTLFKVQQYSNGEERKTELQTWGPTGRTVSERLQICERERTSAKMRAVCRSR